MKRNIFVLIIALLFVVGIAGCFWAIPVAEAASNIWNSCPRDNVNCAYPGECNSYIDTNNDAICDRSQPDPRSLSNLPVNSSNTVADGSNSLIASLPSDSGANTSGESPAASSSTGVAQSDAAGGKSRSYFLIPILAALAGLYGLTWILSSRKIIRYMLHRQVWNMVLLFSTVVSALLGLFLILHLDFDMDIPLPFNMLFWHVEAGIALAVIALFHICWHWRYFAKMLRMNGGRSRSVTAALPQHYERKYSPAAVRDDLPL